MANGIPSPRISWYKSNGELIIYGVSSIMGGSLLALTIKGEDDYGQYICRGTNSWGYNQLSYEVYKIGGYARLNYLFMTNLIKTCVCQTMDWRRCFFAYYIRTLSVTRISCVK
jgi:hypothetical protein